MGMLRQHIHCQRSVQHALQVSGCSLCGVYVGVERAAPPPVLARSDGGGGGAVVDLLLGMLVLYLRSSFIFMESLIVRTFFVIFI